MQPKVTGFEASLADLHAINSVHDEDLSAQLVRGIELRVSVDAVLRGSFVVEMPFATICVKNRTLVALQTLQTRYPNVRRWMEHMRSWLDGSQCCNDCFIAAVIILQLTCVN